MKEFDDKKTEAPQSSRQRVVKPKAQSPAKGRDSSRGPSHPDAAPLAEVLTQLQQSHGNVHVQRVVSEMKEGKTGVKSLQDRGGERLDAGTRSEMELGFGEDFGDVRIHTRSQTTAEHGARALTRGREIYFGDGEYNPSSSEGKEVLAHELAHVVQQRGSLGSQQANSIGQAGDAFELEADQAAASVLRGERARVVNRSAAPSAQRSPRGSAPAIVDLGRYSLGAGDFRPHAWHVDDANGVVLQMLLSVKNDATVDTLHLTVPAGVGVFVIDLSGANAQVHDPGGTGKRPIIIVVPRGKVVRDLQLTLTKGNKVYVVVLEFPTVALPAAPAQGASPPAAGGSK
jgi:hypothetical protein